MAAKGADPSEVRGELMKGVERKLIIDPYQMGPTLPVPPKT